MPRLDRAENDRKKQIEKVSQEPGQMKIGNFFHKKIQAMTE